MTRFHFGTTFLLVALCLVYLFELGTGLAGDELMLLMFGGLPDNGQLHGQAWRLLTYGFLHASPLHILLNCALLLVAGPLVERRIGTLGLLGVFLLASALA